MTTLVAPHVLAVANDEHPTPELLCLRFAANRGHNVGVAVVPSQFEEALYRLNNLPQQLRALFAGLDPYDPDEDILEEQEHEAMSLVQGAVLLEEAVDAFYEAVQQFTFPLVVRRASSATGVSVPHRRAALLAIKRMYASEWTYNALETRLMTTHSLAITPEHILLHEAVGQAAPAVQHELQRALPEAKITGVFYNEHDQIVRITHAERSFQP